VERPVKLAITGNTSLTGENCESKWFGMVPGETATFTATATFADGTERDVTTEVEWRTGQPFAVVVESRGVVRARFAGWQELHADSRPILASAMLRVAPLGASLVTISADDWSFWMGPVLVRATSNAGSFSTTTDLSAPVSLPATGDTVVEFADPALGWLWTRSSLSVARDTFADCNLLSDGCRFRTCEK
jgi:hypothetical protein